MKRKNFKSSIPFLALSALVLLGSCGKNTPKSVNDNVVVQSEYFLNDTVYIPKKQIDCDGVLKDATCSVKTPSGNVSEVRESFVISEFGQYELIYSATHNNRVYRTVTPIEAVRKATDLFTLSSDNLEDAKLVQEPYMFDAAYRGVKATISAGASLAFNQVIDFNDLTMDTPFYSMLVEPHCATGDDCALLELTFTDIDNPSNVMTIFVSDDGGDQFSYVRAGFNGQEAKGWQNYNNTKTSNIHSGKFGNPTMMSFDREKCQNRESKPLQLFFEPNSKQLYVASTRCFPWGTTPSFVVDLDDPRTWGENIWGGFTNGKAKLTITPKQASSSNVTLLFDRIYSYNLIEKKFPDNDCPVITMENVAKSNVGPQAKVGEPYNLFSAKSFDYFDGELETNIAVKYVNPTNNARSDVEIVNNKFTPKIPGVYELIYTSTDRSNNVATKTISVVASNTITPLEVSINDQDKEINVFDDVTLLPASSAVIKGGSGESRVFRTVYDPKGRVVNMTTDVLSTEDIGVYKVVYEAIDYLGHYGTAVIKITSNQIEKPKIVGNFSFPDALLKGFTYDIPTLYAKECTPDGVITKPASVLINGAVYNDSKYVASGDNVTIKYVAKDSKGKTDSITKDFAIRDTLNGTKQDQYFLNTDSEVEVERNYVLYSTNLNTNKTAFLNKINSRSFTLIFNYNFETFNADGVKITLEDESRTHSYTLSAAIGKTDVKLTYPGCVSPQTVATQYNNGNNKIRFTYNSAKGTVTDINSNILCRVNRDDSLKEFPGFEGYVYVSISIVNPDAIKGASIQLEKLSNQTLGYRADSIEESEDTISPEIYLAYEFDRKQVIGSKFIVPKALSCDVLSPISKFTVDMYSRTPEGKVKDYIFRNEDASVEHVIDLNTYDNFLIRYTSVDKAGNEVIATRLLYVIENQPPLLEANYSAFKKVVTVGDKLGIPTYGISDNSSHYEVNVYLIDPNSRMYLLQSDVDGVKSSKLNHDTNVYSSEFYVNDTTWKVLLPGEYRFKIVATDSCYNYASSEYVFYANAK